MPSPSWRSIISRVPSAANANNKAALCACNCMPCLFPCNTLLGTDRKTSIEWWRSGSSTQLLTSSLLLLLLLQVDLYLKTYFLFLSQTLQGLDSFTVLNSLLASTRSGDGSSSQLDFIELFLLGKFTLHGSVSPRLRPPLDHHRGTLRAYLEEAQIFDTSFFLTQDVNVVQATEEGSLGSVRELCDEGRFTRSRAPFLPPPPLHQRNPTAIESLLSSEEKDLISRIRCGIDVCQVQLLFSLRQHSA